MYGYVYMTTNLVNGRKYIGQHTAKQFDKRYIGSGVILKQAIAKYGKEKFLCEILCKCESALELDEREKFWISKFDAVNSDKFYNLSPGGSSSQFIHSEYTKQKMRNSHLGKHLSESTKQKIKESNKGRKFSAEHIQHLKDARKGYRHSKETIQKIRDSNKNKVPWNKGIPMSEEQKQKISITKRMKLLNANSFGV